MTLSHVQFDVLWSSVVSIFIVGGVVGSLCGGWLADWCGRKGSIVVSDILGKFKKIINNKWAWLCKRVFQSFPLDYLTITWADYFNFSTVVLIFTYLVNFVFSGVSAAICFILSYEISSVEMLLLGRFVVGLSSGLTTAVVPMYLTELSPLRLRGATGVLCPLGMHFSKG